MKNFRFFIVLLFITSFCLAQKEDIKNELTISNEKSKTYPNLYKIDLDIFHVFHDKFCFYHCPLNGTEWILSRIENTLLFYYRKPNANELFFYGKNGYKYAYSEDGENSKPVPLKILKTNDKWKVE